MDEVVILGPMGPNLDSNLTQKFVLAVDGGVKWSSRLDLWVGDADSIEGPLPEVPRIELQPQKDRSDLSEALKQIAPSVRLLHLWGFWGGRRDHEWFNLGEVYQFLLNRQASRAFFYDENGLLRVWMAGAGRWPLRHEGTFSVGTLLQNRIRLTGDCDYPLPEKTLLEPFSSHGLSNRGRGEFTVEAEKPILIFLA